MDKMLEVLLTVWAISQEKGNLPKVGQAIPERLMSTFRKAKKLEFIVSNKDGMYLDELGCVYLADHGNPKI